jgi:pyruvate/2-oxoglutarate dehydrogenase complex dihydrolipoamide acyltransferase (E2) component
MPEPTAVVVPRMNTNDDQAVLVKWLVTSGTAVKNDQPVVLMETTKTTFEVNAPRDGYIFFDLGSAIMVDVGASIAWISDDATPPVKRAATATAPARTADEDRFSRKALRLMKDHSLSGSDFPDSERVEVADVERVIAQRASGASSAAAGKAAGKPSGTAIAGAQPLEQLPSKILEARTLERVYRQVVPSTVVMTVDEPKLQARLQMLAQNEAVVSVLELTIFEAAKLLSEFPALNGFYADGRAYSYDHIAIGFAINAGGRSLKVPVIRDCRVSSALHIARSTRDLSLKYMREELVIEDLSGGTFTVTDLSGQGVVNFIPVINERQAAILGICAARPGTGTRDLVLTFDHRMSDGMQAAEFLNQLRDALEG